jgi:phenylalanyl-tRNA synthetase alpha chain
MEPDVSCFLCDGSGCRVCKFSGWIEMGGSGMVDPAVLEFVGYDPDEFSGFAFGLGLERMAQLRHAVPDIRLLWQNDLRVLAQF